MIVGMGQLGIDQGRGFAVFGRQVTAVVGGQFLFDDIGAEGDAEMVGLAGEVRGGMVVDAIYFKAGIAGVTPEDGRHAQFVCDLEGLGNLFQLAVAFCAAPVYGGAYGDGSHVPGGFNAAEKGLVVAVGKAEEFVMVDLYDEGNAVCVFTAHDVQHAKCGGYSITSGFYGQFDDIFGIEIHGVGGEGSAGAVFDTLVHREDRQVTGVGKSSVTDQGLQTSQYLVTAAGIRPYFFYVVRGGNCAECRFVNDGLVIQ